MPQALAVIPAKSRPSRQSLLTGFTEVQARGRSPRRADAHGRSPQPIFGHGRVSWLLLVLRRVSGTLADASGFAQEEVFVQR